MIYDYNVWCEDEHSEIDHWTEDEAEAMEAAASYRREYGVWPTITRYPTRDMPDGTYQTDTSTGEVVFHGYVETDTTTPNLAVPQRTYKDFAV